MLRMTDGEGSVVHYGVLRDDLGFRAESGCGWQERRFGGDMLLAEIAMTERTGHSLNYGPVVVKVRPEVASGIRGGDWGCTCEAVLQAFHEAGAPNV
jgi:hypothetical protein